MTPLTDEQLCEELLAPSGSGDPEAAALRSALGSYRAETLQWAERRSATQSSLAARARQAERWAALPRWSLATIAVVTIAAGVAHVSQDRDGSASMSAPVQAAQPARSSAEDIAADNQLLNSINAELDYHGRSPVDAFNLKHEGTPGSNPEE